jgi:hypothetical protein
MEPSWLNDGWCTFVRPKSQPVGIDGNRKDFRDSTHSTADDFGDEFMQGNWKSGDWAVYRKTKRSASPGRRANQIVASPKGESYSYVVDKFWVVEAALPGDRLLLRTARGKSHVIDAADPNLRRPGLIQRILWRERFRLVERQMAEQPHYAA